MYEFYDAVTTEGFPLRVLQIEFLTKAKNYQVHKEHLRRTVILRVLFHGNYWLKKCIV